MRGRVPGRVTSDGTGAPRGLHVPSPRPAVSRHPVASFLVLVYVIVLGLAVLPLSPEVHGPLENILGVAVPAFVVTALVGGRDGVRDLASRCLRWRVPLRWYAVAVLGLPGVLLLLAPALYGRPPLRALADRWPELFTSFLPTFAVMVVLNSVAEEAGATGFLFARLQDRHGPLRASLVTALCFWLWHAPGVVLEAGTWLGAAAIMGFFVLPHLASRLVVGWMYNASGASVLIGGLFHAMHNATVNPTGFGVAVLGLPQGDVLVVLAGLVVLGGAAVAAVTRGRLGLPSSGGDRPAPSPP
jgi:uncharacterized protein